MSFAVDEDEDSLLLLTAVVEGVTGGLSGTAEKIARELSFDNAMEE